MNCDTTTEMWSYWFKQVDWLLYLNSTLILRLKRYSSIRRRWRSQATVLLPGLEARLGESEQKIEKSEKK